VSAAPLVAIVMGSQSDWETLRHAADMLKQFGIPHESQVVSAHRTPDRMAEFAKGAAARGLQVIIAGAGGAAHLPGMVAAHTWLPVLGVPVESKVLRGTYPPGYAPKRPTSIMQPIPAVAPDVPALAEYLR